MRTVLVILLLTALSGAFVDKFLLRDDATEAFEGAAERDEYRAGYAIYRRHCQICHGPRADGNHAAYFEDDEAGTLGFTSPEFARKTEAHIKRVIREGGQATGLHPLMPEWKSILTDREIDLVTRFVTAVGREGRIRARRRIEGPAADTASSR